MEFPWVCPKTRIYHNIDWCIIKFSFKWPPEQPTAIGWRSSHSAQWCRRYAEQTLMGVDPVTWLRCVMDFPFPLVNKQKTIENGPVEIVDLPIYPWNMVIFHSYVSLPESRFHRLSHGFQGWLLSNWCQRCWKNDADTHEARTWSGGSRRQLGTAYT